MARLGVAAAASEHEKETARAWCRSTIRGAHALLEVPRATSRDRTCAGSRASTGIHQLSGGLPLNPVAIHPFVHATRAIEAVEKIVLRLRDRRDGQEQKGGAHGAMDFTLLVCLGRLD